ncbi:MAG TPA: zinc ribbon domain-containing protein [Candidatus Sulfopaludibacter sp.]|jgi:DNA-directed RNA polymerase subunit M/transcription elongation factor TFIIS|nr:zinc ribbon domain-containing protein [Candidatus Sulfopaludibacter sp.]
MESFDKYDNIIMNKCNKENDFNIIYLKPENAIQYANENSYSMKDDDAEKVDINTEEKENIQELHKYQQYQEDQQDQQPWGSSSDIRLVESDELPDPHPITDTEVCPKCGNNQSRWWIVQTDSADEPSTQFFRCTKCMHTWRTPKSS